MDREDVGIGGRQAAVDCRQNLPAEGCEVVGRLSVAGQQSVELGGLDVDALAIGLAIQGHHQGHNVDVEFCRLGRRQAHVCSTIGHDLHFVLLCLYPGGGTRTGPAGPRGQLWRIDQQQAVLVRKQGCARRLVRDHGATVIVALARAVPLAGVEVVLVRHVAATQRLDDRVLLIARHDRVLLALKDGQRRDDPVGMEDGRALTVDRRRRRQGAEQTIKAAGLKLVRLGGEGEVVGDAVEADAGLEEVQAAGSGLARRCSRRRRRP